MLLFLISFVASVNDSIGYNYLMEYDPGVVSYHNLYLYGSGSYSFEESEAGSGRSALNINYYKRYYSSKNDWYLRINPYGSFNNINGENNISVNLICEGDYKMYPVSIPLFISFGVDPYSMYRWREGDDLSDYSTRGQLRAGVGFGRIIPLSEAYRVLKIEEELIELGELDENISEEELRLITDFLSNRSRYLDVREFWRDFEDILRNLKGFNSDRLGAVPTIRIDEIINGSSYVYTMQRDRGYNISSYLGFEFYRTNIPSIEINQARFFLGGNFSYSRPLSTKLQFLFNSRAETYISDSLGIKSIDILSSLYYEMLKKLYLTFSSGYSKDIDRYFERNREYVYISLAPTYYIQYRMSVGLRGTYYHYINDTYSGDTYSGSLSAFLRYYLF